MNDVGVAGWVRRRLPQTVRVRLSLLYAFLFLLAGAALLAVTYGLVASSIPETTSSKFTAGREAKAALFCKIEGSGSAAKPASGKAEARPVPGTCRTLFDAGANVAASSQRDQTLHNLLLFSLIGLGAMTLASGGLGWLMAGRALRPVRTITDAARRASEQHLGERLDMQGPRDELKELADTFDQMLDRLDSSFASQRRFVADASHELRTPLTVMRTAIDVTLAKPSRSPEQLEAMASKVRRSVDQAESLIEALLTLARSEHDPSNRELVDMATIAEDALDSASTDVSRLELRVKADLEPAETTGDRLLLGRMIANLLGNAVRHNKQGRWIDVLTGTAENSAFVSVSNSGPVIPSEVVEGLFEPFRRIEVRTSEREGFGLGLAIVKSIAESHGAKVEARAQLGGGLTVSVIIPQRSDL